MAKATTNYGLLIYEPNDVTSYLVNWNNTMQKIDESMGGISAVAEKAEADIATTEQSLANANDEINELTGEVSDVKQELTATTARSQTNAENITNLQTSVANTNTRVDDVVKVVGTRYAGILSTNEDTIAIATPVLTDDSLIDVYTSIYGVNPITIAPDVQAKQVVMTFTAQSADMDVMLVIK